MYALNDGIRVIFRRYFSDKVYTIRNIFLGKWGVDQYNIKVQIQKVIGGVKVIDNLHINPNLSGGFTWWGKDGVIRKWNINLMIILS